MGHSKGPHEWVWYERFQMSCCASCGVPQDEDTGRCEDDPFFCHAEAELAVVSTARAATGSRGNVLSFPALPPRSSR
jgi:hypothetical protein